MVIRLQGKFSVVVSLTARQQEIANQKKIVDAATTMISTDNLLLPLLLFLSANMPSCFLGRECDVDDDDDVGVDFVVILLVTF